MDCQRASAHSLQGEPLHLDPAIQVTVRSGRFFPTATDKLEAVGVQVGVLGEQGVTYGLGALA